MRILSPFELLFRLAKNNEDEDFLKKELREFTSTLLDDLSKIQVECRKTNLIMVEAMRSNINDHVSDELVNSISETIAYYHGALINSVGELSESYMLQRSVTGIDELREKLLGNY